MVGYLGELDVIKDFSNFKVLLCDNCVWITNYIKIIEYSKEQVRLKVKNNILVIAGVDINIKMLDKKEIILQGKINNIFLENPYKVESKNVEKI